MYIKYIHTIYFNFCVFFSIGGADTCHGTHMDIKGQFAGVISSSIT